MSLVQSTFEYWFTQRNECTSDEWQKRDNNGKYMNLVIQGMYEVWLAAWVFALRSIEE